MVNLISLERERKLFLKGREDDVWSARPNKYSSFSAKFGPLEQKLGDHANLINLRICGIKKAGRPQETRVPLIGNSIYHNFCSTKISFVRAIKTRLFSKISEFFDSGKKINFQNFFLIQKKIKIQYSKSEVFFFELIHDFLTCHPRKAEVFMLADFCGSWLWQLPK